MLDRWHCSAVERVPEVKHYRRLFEEIKPSVLFCSHQRPVDILPPVLAVGDAAFQKKCLGKMSEVAH